MFIGDIENGIVTWSSHNIVQRPSTMFQVGYLPTKSIHPSTRRWLEEWYGVRGSRIAVVTPSWGVAGHFQWTDSELRWFGVKKTPVIETTCLVNQPVIVLWDRPERLAIDGSDSIRIIR